MARRVHEDPGRSVYAGTTLDLTATTGDRPPTGALTRRLSADALRLLVENTSDYAIFMLDPD